MIKYLLLIILFKCKKVSQFPNLATFSPEYSAWWNAIKYKIEPIQAYALRVEPIVRYVIAISLAVASSLPVLPIIIIETACFAGQCGVHLSFDIPSVLNKI
ncbi:hypothetical protein C7212DRAFT_344912 [Tuber magnatum]|uniref:CSC1/OSCA1-like 7TM region domain-containing protein n=1 Tax=Tuber magnatum TaxID=42249 RepID=A0A317SNR1_9PEZI|nr:hypothetical protein C7212DRAFT_344912 [Tuber magnatum]